MTPKLGLGNDPDGRTRRWLRAAAGALALSYVVALVVTVFLLRSVGERWWLTGVVMYLPRIGFLLPLPFTALLLLAFGPRKLLYSQALALLIVVFPLMGFTAPWPHSKGSPSLRLMSFNVDSLYFGPDKVADEIDALAPDIVVLQEIGGSNPEFLERLRKRFSTVQVSTQFLLATRFPVRETVDPPRIPCYGRLRSPRFMRYVLDTSLGPVTLYNVHPISPRWGFHSLRGQGLRKEIASGRLFAATNSEPLHEDNVLRGLQVEAFSKMASAETGPVLVAGDTNLPGLSEVLTANLSGFSDGFREAGAGFGYTFPVSHPWMRIDRMFSTRTLAFTSFSVGCRWTSDHLCIVADLKRAD